MLNRLKVVIWLIQIDVKIYKPTIIVFKEQIDLQVGVMQSFADLKFVRRQFSVDYAEPPNESLSLPMADSLSRVYSLNFP